MRASQRLKWTIVASRAAISARPWANVLAYCMGASAAFARPCKRLETKEIPINRFSQIAALRSARHLISAPRRPQPYLPRGYEATRWVRSRGDVLSAKLDCGTH